MVSLRVFRGIGAEEEMLHRVHVVSTENIRPTVIAFLMVRRELFFEEFLGSAESGREVSHVHRH
jgi:hypothetical protein